jgi:hypothetical protein
VAGLASIIAVLVCGSANGAIAASDHGATDREIIVRGPQWAQGVTISLHDTVIVPPPARYDEWRVHVASAKVVRLLTSGSRVRRPAAEGWRLEAVGHGETTVAFTPFVPSGEDSSAPNEPHFTLKVTVR